MIFGGTAQHRWAADVDVFNCVGERNIGFGDGFLEGIEVDDDEVDERNFVVLALGDVDWVVAVYSETSMTGKSASRRALAVPPVESNSTPRAWSSLANSASPVLSETESRARVIGMVVTGCRVGGRWLPSGALPVTDPGPSGKRDL